ncbi:hypothetical protein DID77_00200 [Candidatus Marinamargulisbacteria bacterium SCGC AG-439-L15]|nr:hypothetical protein DID77_00200 [Candidatus Marinamargulisbacteria bacterium SCGC AG-439-L15]
MLAKKISCLPERQPFYPLGYPIEVKDGDAPPRTKIVANSKAGLGISWRSIREAIQKRIKQLQSPRETVLSRILSAVKKGVHLYKKENPRVEKQLEKSRHLGPIAEEESLVVRELLSQKTLLGLLKKYPELKSTLSNSTSLELARIIGTFESGAMSYGSNSKPVHEDAAFAINSVGGMSNSGEGGLPIDRRGTMTFTQIVQRASGLFGNDLAYFLSADEVQIKLAQGAKPGEGGTLPGGKVSEAIAKTRHVRKGTTLISPQVLHEVYSIEDLYLLIHALKCLKPGMRVCVKLVSDPEVAITALGAAKCGADKIVIAGNNGGTGAAKVSSIFNTGLPWEWGVASTHDLLTKIGLRDSVELVASGGIATGKDIVHAHLFGADKVEFGTSVLVALGCIMLRKCHSPRQVSPETFFKEFQKQYPEKEEPELTRIAKSVFIEMVRAGFINEDTSALTLRYQEIEKEASIEMLCEYLEKEDAISKYYLDAIGMMKGAKGGCTVGVNTQDPQYVAAYERKEKESRIESLQLMYYFLADSANQILKKELGVRTLDESRGRAKEFLECKEPSLDKIFMSLRNKAQEGVLHSPLKIPCDKDLELIEAISQQKDDPEIDVIEFNNVALTPEKHSSFTVALSAYCETHSINKKIVIRLKPGTVAPQNLGSFLRENIHIVVQGDGNDHIGKSNSGGRITIKRPSPDRNVCVGNQVMFGATKGHFFIDGDVGTRAFIRLSGGRGVCLNAGDHFCEFMTAGEVLVLGKVGRNFASGMTGGFVFIDSKENPEYLNNRRLLDFRSDGNQKRRFNQLLEDFYQETESREAKKILDQLKTSDTSKTVFDRFRVLNPYPMNMILKESYSANLTKTLCVFPEYQLLEDDNVLSFLGQLKPGEDNYQKMTAYFTGRAGSRFTAYAPSNAVCFHSGEAGSFLAQDSKGTLIMSECPNLHKSRYALLRNSGKNFIKGSLGALSCQEFNGLLVCDKMGPGSGKQMGPNAKIVVCGEIPADFGVGMSPEAKVYSLKSTEIRTEIELTSEDYASIRSVLETFLQYKPGDQKVSAYLSKTDEELSSLFQKHLPKPLTVLAGDEITRIKKHSAEIEKRQAQLGWTLNGRENLLKMGGDEPTYSMGNQSGLLGDRPDSFSYFVQAFAQETRPPIDKGSEGDFIHLDLYLNGKDGKKLHLKTPILTPESYRSIKDNSSHFTLSLSLDISDSDLEDEIPKKLEVYLKALKEEVRKQTAVSKTTLILSHHESEGLPIPSWIIAGQLRRFIDDRGFMMDIIVETDELINPHALDVLITSCGVKAVYPRLVMETLRHHHPNRSQTILGVASDAHARADGYKNAMSSAMRRIMAKNGDNDLTTRCNSKLNYALGLDEELAKLIGISCMFPNGRYTASYFLKRTLGQLRLVKPRPTTQFSGKGNRWDGESVKTLQSALAVPDIENLGKKSLFSQADFKSFEEGMSAKKVNFRDYFEIKEPVKNVAIVGGGTSSLKEALILAEKDLEVTIFCKEAYLGGKGVYAIAPDHPKAKRVVVNEIKKVLAHPKIEVVTSVRVDEQLLESILERYSHTIVATGAKKRRLDSSIPGNEHAVYFSKVVAWYNQKPSKTDEKRSCPLDLTHETTVVSGGGNAALDIARVLIAPNLAAIETQESDRLSSLLELDQEEAQFLSDQKRSESVSMALKASRLKHVVLMYRGAAMKDKFSIQELVELEHIESIDLVVRCNLENTFSLLQSKYETLDESIKKEAGIGELKQDKVSVVADALTSYLRGNKRQTESVKPILDALKKYLFYESHQSEGVYAGSKKLIEFLFESDLDAELGIVCSDGSRDKKINILSNGQSKVLVAGNYIPAIGSLSHSPLSNLSLAETGEVSILDEISGEKLVIPFMTGIGQASTNRGTLGDAERSVSIVMDKVERALVSAPKRPSDRPWIHDEFEGLTKDVYIGMLHIIHQNRCPFPETKKDIEKVMLQAKQRIDDEKKGAVYSVLNQNPRVPTKVVKLSYNGEEIMGGPNDNLRDAAQIKDGSCGSAGTCKECPTYNETSSCEVLLGDIEDLVLRLLDGKVVRDKADCGLGLRVEKKASSVIVQEGILHLCKDRSRGAGVDYEGDGVGFTVELDKDSILSDDVEFVLGRDLLSREHLQTRLQNKPWGICQVFAEESELDQIKEKLNNNGLMVEGVRVVPFDRSKFHSSTKSHPPIYQLIVSNNEKSKFDSAMLIIQNTPSTILENPENLLSISDTYATFKLAAYGDEILALKEFQNTTWKSRFFLSHVRFSTTTLSVPGKAHPHQRLIHNGEILSKDSMVRWLHEHRRTLATINIHINQDQLMTQSDSAVLNHFITHVQKWINFSFFDQLILPLMNQITRWLGDYESNLQSDGIQLAINNALKNQYETNLSKPTKADIIDLIRSTIKSTDSVVSDDALKGLGSVLKHMADFRVSIPTIIHMLVRSDRVSETLERLNTFGALLKLPKIIGPCNFGMLTRYNDKETLVFSRGEMGFRPARLIQTETGFEIVSGQYCSLEGSSVRNVKEGEIVMLTVDGGSIDYKIEPNFSAIIDAELSKIVTIPG